MTKQGKHYQRWCSIGYWSSYVNIHFHLHKSHNELRQHPLNWWWLCIKQHEQQRMNYTSCTYFNGTDFSQTGAAAYLSCGTGQGVALQPSLSGTCGTLLVHRWVGSGWTVVPLSMPPTANTEKAHFTSLSLCAAYKFSHGPSFSPNQKMDQTLPNSNVHKLIKENQGPEYKLNLLSV